MPIDVIESLFCNFWYLNTFKFYKNFLDILNPHFSTCIVLSQNFYFTKQLTTQKLTTSSGRAGSDGVPEIT